MKKIMRLSWLFGAGDCEDKIKEYATRDPRIKFFGRKPREEIIEYERKATLLVNVRDSSEEFTKYSFPSKTIEYMLSGTPLLTTKLPGIPDEYYSYAFEIDGADVGSIKTQISKVLSMSDGELIKFGSEAQKFIVKNKNSAVQARKIFDFIEKTNELRIDKHH